MAIPQTVTIGSKLPFALVLRHPLDRESFVTIGGLNSAARGLNNHPVVVSHWTTEVDGQFWAAWDAAHGLKSKRTHPAIKSGALFVAKDAASAAAIAKEFEKRVTGLEGMGRNGDPRVPKNETTKPVE